MPVCHNAIHQRNCACPSISPQQVVTASKKVLIKSQNPRLHDRVLGTMSAPPQTPPSWPLLRPQASKSSSLTPTPPISSDPSPSPSPSPPSSSSPISTSSSFLTFFALAFLTGVPSSSPSPPPLARRLTFLRPRFLHRRSLPIIPSSALPRRRSSIWKFPTQRFVQVALFDAERGDAVADGTE
jgi:hypothetical protein